MDVTLPSGQVIQDVPEGTTRAQLAEKLKRNGMDVPPEWMSSAPRQEGAKLSDIPGAAWQQTKDLLGGAVRGAASIGATLLAPNDLLNQTLMEQRGLKPGNVNEQRRADVTAALNELGANPDSMSFGAGKLGAEIAGTAGVGGVLGGLASKLPFVPQALVSALTTSGMKAGGATGLPAMAARMVGGGATGGAAAALVNPEDAATGAGIGAAMPGAVAIGGKIGNIASNVIRGPAQSQDAVAAINAARNAGYVIPPSQANPNLANRILEGLSGKLTTAQNASAKNQAITNAKAAASVGLPTDTPITVDSLKAVRDVAGQAYADLGSTGMITPRQPYFDALDKIAQPYKLTAQAFPNAKPSPVLDLVDSLRSPGFASASAVEKIKQLRTAADDAFRSGNTDVGRAARDAAIALENAIEDHLQVIGEPQKLQAFKDARQLIAKTYSVEKALNPATGTVDARKLGQQIAKGKPLSGDLKDIGQFAMRFPKASQPVEAMGSLPQTSPLDWAMGGGLAMGTGNPLMLASMAARPAARYAILSPLVQNRLVQKPGLSSLITPAVEQLGYRSAPVLWADR